MENHYCVLGIGPQASSEEIKSAYRRCAREAHPDRRGSAERFRVVQTAYAVLSDPEKRARYDEERRAWMAKIGAVACKGCGHANRITRWPPRGHIARCWHCKGTLALRYEDLDPAERQRLAEGIAQVLDTVGGELAELAVDGVRAGLGRLRKALGIGRGDRGPTT